jgi:hypothetical protein
VIFINRPNKTIEKLKNKLLRESHLKGLVVLCKVATI